MLMIIFGIGGTILAITIAAVLITHFEDQKF